MKLSRAQRNVLIGIAKGSKALDNYVPSTLRSLERFGFIVILDGRAERTAEGIAALSNAEELDLSWNYDTY